MTGNKKILTEESIESFRNFENLKQVNILESSPNCGSAFYFLTPLLKYGKFSCAFSYGLRSSFTGKVLEYSTKQLRILGVRFQKIKKVLY